MEQSATIEAWLASSALMRIVARVGYRYGLKSDDLSDLLQEVRLATWEAGPGTRVRAAWLFRVATNKAVDFLRQESRTRRHCLDFASRAERTTQDDELNHLLHARVDLLPKRLRQFYDLRYVKGFSEREIARSLGICRASVRWMNQSCRKHLAGDVALGGLSRSRH